MTYYAHTRGTDRADWQTVLQHLTATAELARSLGADSGLAEFAAAAAMLHDLGKYSCEFQQRLEGSPKKVDHATAGAKEIDRLLAQEVAEGLGLLENLTFTHWNGERREVVEPEHLASLRIRRGSLSEAERLEIESHVTQTFRFLERIPWTRDLAGIPEIAYAHHERLSGRGYPRQLGATEIPVQSRAMAIADVFDALTARDRPYKGAVSLERSLAILEEEARDGAIDRPLLDLFIEAKVFERTRSRG